MAEEKQDVQMTMALTAGQMLREARTTGRRKREIATIAKQLCIREEFLQALEDGDYAVLPETVYILGFARNYAMELGINPDVVVDRIKQELGLVTPDAPAPKVEVVPEKKDVAKKERINFSEKFAKVRDSKCCKFVVKNWKWFVGGLLALVLLFGVLALLLPSGEDHTSAEAVVETVVNEPKYKVTVRERFGKENKNTAEVILQTTQESWVKIEDGRGKTVFSRVLIPGDVYYVPAGGKHKATFGNVAGVDIWVRGELVPKLSEEHVRKNGVLMDADALLKKTSESDEK